MQILIFCQERHSNGSPIVDNLRWVVLKLSKDFLVEVALDWALRESMFNDWADRIRRCANRHVVVKVLDSGGRRD
jgi:hypothetical protein